MTIWFSATGFKGDQVLFPVVATLAGLGLLEIQRLDPVLADRGPAWANVAQRQVLFLAVGLMLLWSMMVFVKRLDWLRRYKYTWAFFGLALMAVTMVFGETVYGARLWLNLGFVTVQPSELVKVLLVVFLAAYLDDYGDLIAGSYRVGPLKLPPIPYLLPMVIMWLASLAIVVLQNDLGTALLFFGIFLVMIYVATGRLLYIVVGLGEFCRRQSTSRISCSIESPFGCRTGSIPGQIRSTPGFSKSRRSTAWPPVISSAPGSAMATRNSSRRLRPTTFSRRWPRSLACWEQSPLSRSICSWSLVDH